MNENRFLLPEEEWNKALQVLESAPIAYLSMAGAEPYVVPMCFAYDAQEQSQGPGRLIFHTGEGRKTRALAENGRVCLAMVADAVFDRGPEPCRDSYAFRSVVVEGTASLVEDDDARESALRTIVGKYDPQARERPFGEKDLQATLVYVVAVRSLSYKEQQPRS